MVSAILRAAARNHASVEVVTRREQAGPHRSTYAAIEHRCRRLARVLGRLGVAPGDRVAILAWDGAPALELFYAVVGIGAVAHPLDPRQPPHRLAEALADGRDVVLFAEPAFASAVAAIAPAVRHTLRRVVMLCDEMSMPVVPLPATVGLHCYEPLLAAEGEDHAWAEFDEALPAALCETSGGGRRAVPVSHRELVLAALVANQADGLGIRAVDRVLACGALLGFGAWGALCAAPMAGAALLLPGPPTDGAGLYGFADAERATPGIGVPAGWQALLTAGVPASLRRLVCTGAVVPAALRHGFAVAGVAVAQVWGLAEAGPAATHAAPAAATASLTGEAAERRHESHGRAPFGLELRLRDGDGHELPWDGMAVGRLCVRGPLLAASAVDAEGWLDTGDTASLDANGHLLLRDRAEDAIRSGGEWIGAAAVERAALAHPDVAEAACVAVRHPKFLARPLLLVVARPGARLAAESVRRACAARLPAWWVPDTVLQRDELPRTVTGRIDKATLRAQHAAAHAGTSQEQQAGA
jgi:3-(methylthio)propionyl---CoA ligase